MSNLTDRGVKRNNHYDFFGGNITRPSDEVEIDNGYVYKT